MLRHCCLVVMYQCLCTHCHHLHGHNSEHHNMNFHQHNHPPPPKCTIFIYVTVQFEHTGLVPFLDPCLSTVPSQSRVILGRTCPLEMPLELNDRCSLNFSGHVLHYLVMADVQSHDRHAVVHYCKWLMCRAKMAHA